MKKKILIAILTVFVLSSYAKDKENNKFNFQFDLGTNISIPYKNKVLAPTTLLPTENNGCYKTVYNSSFGYYLEVLTSYQLSDKFSISSGINYNYTSIKITDEEGLSVSKGNLTHSYMNIPLIIRYKIMNNIPLYISTGGYLGFMVNAKEKGTTYLDTARIVVVDPNDPLLQAEQNYNNDITSDFKNLDFGLLFQLEYEIKFSEKITGVFLSRFNYGLQEVILTQKEIKHSSAYEWKNYGILIGFGIKL